MHKLKAGIGKFLLAILLSFTTIGVVASNTEVTYVEAAVKTPKLKEESATIVIGEGAYTIKLLNLTNKAKITYSSSDDKIATVSKTGAITTKKAGKVKVIVSVQQDGKTYQLTSKITIRTPYIEWVTSYYYSDVGDTAQFKAKVHGTSEKITWSVSDSSIAEISSTGKLTSKAAGIVTVYAKAGKLEVKQELLIGTARLGTFDDDITISEDRTIYIYVKDSLKSDEVVYENQNPNIVECEWGDWVGDYSALKLKVGKPGEDYISVTSNDGKELIVLHVTVVKKEKKKELTPKKLYSLCGPSTVEILAEDGSDSALGSGFFITENLVVTNYHVIAGASKITVTTKDNLKHEVKMIAGYNEDLDLALLQTSGKEYPYLNMGNGKVAVGEDVYALGSPLGLTGTMTSGMVSTSSRVLDDVDYVQSTAPISSGNSGGPLVNSKGEVIGINTMYYVDGQNLNFSINIKELQKIDTFHPITVEAFYKAYMDELQAEIEANTIQEDPAKSQKASTCQEVPSMSRVLGTVTAAEGGDLYWFRVSEPGWYYGYVKLNTLEDYKNTYFDLYNSNFDYITGCNEYEEELMLYTKYYLNPGDYYVYVYLPKEYAGADVPYKVFLLY